MSKLSPQAEARDMGLAATRWTPSRRRCKARPPQAQSQKNSGRAVVPGCASAAFFAFRPGLTGSNRHIFTPKFYHAADVIQLGGGVADLALLPGQIVTELGDQRGAGFLMNSDWRRGHHHCQCRRWNALPAPDLCAEGWPSPEASLCVSWSGH